MKRREGCLCSLTFEVRRDQRQDARPGLVKMYPYHRPGPGGLPLGLASTEWLGLTARLNFDTEAELNLRTRPPTT